VSGRGLLAVAVALASGCAGATTRRVQGVDSPAHPAGVLHMVWRSTLHEHGLFEPAPEECATGALAGGHLVIGSRAGNVVGVAPETGHVDWVTGVSGGVDSVARYDAARAERAFHQCDPENRLVARSLEARWEEKLRELTDADSELAAQTEVDVVVPPQKRASREPQP